MTTERFDITVREDGSKEVDRKIRKIGTGAKETESAVAKLNTLLKSLIGVGIIERLRQYADTYTNLQNRLKLVTNSTAQLSVVQQKLFDISQKTRSSLPANVELFTRLSFATKELGTSQAELLTLTERINKAIVISGANTQEAQNALIQFAQGLSSGALQGEELRSVLEQLPRVADVIAKQFGVLNPDIEVTRAALKELGKQGKITPEVILTAFRNFGGTLDQEFGLTTATIGQAFLKLNNSILKSFGELDAKLGISSTIVAGVDFLRENLELLGRVAIATGIAFAVGLVAKGINKAITGLKDLAAYILKNPFTFLAQSLTVVISLLTAFSDRITISKDGLVTLEDFGKAAFDVLINGGTNAAKATDTSTNAINNLAIDGQTAFDAITKGIINVIAALANAGDSAEIFYQTLVLGYREIIISFSNLPQDFSIIFAKALNGAIQIVEDGVNKITKSLSSVTEFVGAGRISDVALGRLNENFPKTDPKTDPEVIEATNRIKELEASRDARVANLTKLLESIKSAAKEISDKRIADKAKADAEEAAALKALEEASDKASKLAAASDSSGSGKGAANDNQKISLKEILSDLEQQGKLLQLNNREREIQNQLIGIENEFKREGIPLNQAEKDLLESRLSNLQALNDQAQIYDQIKGPLIENQRSQEALNALYEQGKISIDEYNQALNNLQTQALETDRTLEGGLSRGLGRVAEEFGNVSTVAEDLVVNAFGKAEDALVDFVETGKLSFKDLVNSIQADLTRLAVRQLVTAPLAGLLGGASGGLSGLFGGAAGGASGTSPLTASSPAGNVSYSPAGSSGGFFSDLFGFANGGQFQVGGQGGTDSQLVAFRASPNETVTVNKPGQSQGGGNIVINIQTQDVASFKRSEGQILGQFAQNLSRQKKRMT